jgi:hypothetical protein
VDLTIAKARKGVNGIVDIQFVDPLAAASMVDELHQTVRFVSTHLV